MPTIHFILNPENCKNDIESDLIFSNIFQKTNFGQDNNNDNKDNIDNNKNNNDVDGMNNKKNKYGNLNNNIKDTKTSDSNIVIGNSNDRIDGISLLYFNKIKVHFFNPIKNDNEQNKSDKDRLKRKKRNREIIQNIKDDIYKNNSSKRYLRMKFTGVSTFLFFNSLSLMSKYSDYKIEFL